MTIAFWTETRKEHYLKLVEKELKVRKYNPVTRKHEIFVEKKLPPPSK